MEMKSFKLIVLTAVISLVGGCFGAYALYRLAGASNSSNQSQYVSVSDTTESDFTFTSFAQQVVSPNNLPDLTGAAETAIKAVVNVENIKEVAVNNGFGGGMFDFFFGPFGGYGQQPQQQQPQTQKQRSGGSGVIISDDGYIVTNNHVIEGATELKVTLQTGEKYDAKLIGTDPSTDVALIKIEADNLPTLPFGNSEDLRLGQWVLAIGNPMGLNGTVTAGIISAKGRSLREASDRLDVTSFIQHDAVVNPGNSGGALVNMNGQLVGINTIIKSNTGSYIGYSFAVPSSIVRKVVTDLKQYGTVQRAFLGISYAEITADWLEQNGKKLEVTEKEGLYVAEVTPESAAEEAGIKKGDVIVGVDGKSVKSSAVLQETLAKLRPGDKIKITVRRSGNEKQFDVTLRNKTGKAELLEKGYVDVQNALGAKFQEAPQDVCRKLDIKGGLQVVSVTEGGILARSRIPVGFVVTAINGNAVMSLTDLNRMSSEIESIDGVYPDGRKISFIVVK